MKTNTHNGMTLIEIVIALGIFVVGITAGIILVFDTGQTSVKNITRTHAILSAQEGIEAVRAIRDYDFDLLANGVYDTVITGGVWELDPNPETVDGFLRTVTIESGETDDHKMVTSTVSWNVGTSQERTLTFSELVTNWKREPITDIECFFADLSGASIEQGSAYKIIRYIWISNPSCDRSIELDKIRLTWNIPGNNIFKVRINKNFLWQGNQPSGTVLDLVPNQSLPSGAAPIEIDQLRWVSSILRSDILVEFIMSDGSSESFVIPAF